MTLISGCAKADEVVLIGHLTPIIGVGDEEDTVVELIEWPHLKGSRVEYPIGSSWFREFCKAKSSIDGIWGHAFAYMGNFFRTCSVSQEGDYLYLLPDLAKEKKSRRLGDKVSLEYVQSIVKDSRTDGFCYYLAQFDYGLTLPLSNLAKNVMNLIGACPTQLNCNFWEVILVCETLNGRWATSGSEKKITAKDFLEYYAVKYVTTTNSTYLSSSSSRPYFFDLSSAGRVWNDNLLWVSSECLQRSNKEPLELNNRTITKGTELEAVLKELEISRFKWVASKDDKVRRLQAKRRLAGKTLGSMEEKLSIPELNTPLKLARLNEILDGPVDMATVSSTIVRNLTKRKAIKRGAAPHSVSSFARALRDVQLGFQDRSMELEKRISQLEGEKNQLEENLTRERGAFQLEREKEREAAALKLKKVRAESEAEAERLVTASATSRINLAGELYQLGYTKAEITTFSEGIYEEMEIIDEEEVEEREDGLNLAEKSAADNQETINQYEDRLNDNVKLSLKHEEAKRQVEQKTVTILSRDLALNQLTNELGELKEKAVSGSWHEGERLRAGLIQAKNKSLVEDLAHARGNVRRDVQREKEMNKIINQLCTRISESERELRVRKMKYQRDLKFELDKRDGEIASGEGSREMKEFLRRKEELVENMRIDLTNSRQKSIDLARQMNERIDQLTADLAESKARHLKDNKRTVVTHQAFKELVVHEQE
ncbi:hypothetical protein GIB67_027734 [Kingdonia uniflora]|uniref:Uncharacterized protein n=1 Tax=Kingdonia uniflora TaxID=39325 RepID=A0A7J7PCU5_9MAGN|nr:hypothetical protein GIB67_027734 [Kingdonia uniflora]